MSKYSFEFKLEVVQDYLSGETGGYKAIAKKHGKLTHSLIVQWVKDYEKYGEKCIKTKKTKTFYSGEFKLKVLQYRQVNECSYRETANYFGITNGSMIANWQRKYLDEGLEGLNKSIGRLIICIKIKKEKFF